MIRTIRVHTIPLVKKFGDIPEVRAYIRLKQKFRYGIGLNVDEAIELYTVDAHLYPSLEATKARLKSGGKRKKNDTKDWAS